MTSLNPILSFALQALGLSETAPIQCTPLAGRGSDRTFYRLGWGTGCSAILIHYDARRIENTLYADIAQFLAEIDVPVPHLIGHDRNLCLMIMEDLGDSDLWALRDQPWDIRKALYIRTLAVVCRLHSFPADRIPADRVIMMKPFDAQLYAWERNYFRENFVAAFCRIEPTPASTRELEKELQALAERVLSTNQCLVHRDLQSQNIMIRNKEPYLIDFQGMRFGSSFYDLGSLLCDPYVSFSLEEVEELLASYYDLTKRDYTWPSFCRFFWEASVQRLMQALGAYGFLGLRKGLPAFLNHIPSGLSNLRRAASQIPDMPCFCEILDECQASLTMGRRDGEASFSLKNN